MREKWGSILRGAWAKDVWGERMRHVAYAGAWKRLEPMWDLIIRAKRASAMLPVLEATLAAFGTRSSRKAAREQRNTEFVGPALSAEAKQVSPEMAGVIAHTSTNRLPVIQKTSTQEDSGASATTATSVVDHLHARDKEGVSGDRLLDLLT